MIYTRTESGEVADVKTARLVYTVRDGKIVRYELENIDESSVSEIISRARRSVRSCVRYGLVDHRLLLLDEEPQPGPFHLGEDGPPASVCGRDHAAAISAPRSSAEE